MRQQVLHALHSLSDPEYQQRVWVDRRFPNSTYYDDFRMALHALYDDTSLGTDVHMAVGSILRDDTEARLVGEVIQALEEVFGECGIHDFEVIRACSG